MPMTTTLNQAGTLTRRVDQALERMDTVEEVGTRVSRAVHAAVLDGGEPTRQLADALHGTWLGHPLHPVLTDVTVGAWTMGALFDVIGELTDDDFSRRVGDRLTAVGTASALPTALTGLADYSTVKQSAVTPTTVHAAMNYVGTAMYLMSLRERNRGRRRKGLAWSMLAYGLTGASAWLGGHLVYKHGVGVSHREEFDGPADWTPILPVAELARGGKKCVKHDGKSVLLYRDGDAFHAIGTVCSHAGGLLHEGETDGPFVECPLHQSVFDMRDGSIRHGPATVPQVAFDARERDGQIEIRLRGR
jgi:nitrite reductase/ring-hydroxylating ferredoxin subunit/uncharacterized membrane protein